VRRGREEGDGAQARGERGGVGVWTGRTSGVSIGKLAQLIGGQLNLGG
jgi:hypothetical protein